MSHVKSENNNKKNPELLVLVLFPQSPITSNDTNIIKLSFYQGWKGWGPIYKYFWFLSNFLSFLPKSRGTNLLHQTDSLHFCCHYSHSLPGFIVLWTIKIASHFIYFAQSVTTTFFFGLAVVLGIEPRTRQSRYQLSHIPAPAAMTFWSISLIKTSTSHSLHILKSGIKALRDPVWPPFQARFLPYKFSGHKTNPDSSVNIFSL